MRYPNLRYGDPAALAFYTQFLPEKDRVRLLARQLRRSERSVRDWLSGAVKMPWWVPEIVRLQKLEQDEMLRQMNMKPRRLNPVLVMNDQIRLEHGVGTQRAGAERQGQGDDRDRHPLVEGERNDQLVLICCN